MRHLMRDSAPLTDGQWSHIDAAVVAEASKILAGRRFLDVKVVGAHTQTVPLDTTERPKAAAADFWGNAATESAGVAARRHIELATVYADFTISWRDIGDEESAGVQPARDAAILAAKREDELIFHGDAKLGADGIFTVKGAYKHAISDWSKGENAVTDLAKCIETLVDLGNSGERALIVSTDLYAKLHRIQPNTGLMEVERVRSLAGKLLHSNKLHKNTACLLYSEAQNMDLVVGQDLITAYTGNEKLDHTFRVLETLALRIKRPQAIAILR